MSFTTLHDGLGLFTIVDNPQCAMSTLGKVAKFGGAGLALLVLAGGGFYVNAGMKNEAYMAKTYEAHTQEIPVPFPLNNAEMSALRAERTPPVDPAAPPVDPNAPAVDVLEGVDVVAIATERGAARGKHLVEARFACIECHGDNFGGGTMIDDPAIGKVLGPNLTMGKGSKSLSYTSADWERKVRHGINPGGSSGPMPSGDFVKMSDQELSDIITYIRTLPPIDNEVAALSLGPVGRILMATGQIKNAADEIGTQATEHTLVPPASDQASLELGNHVLNVCSGCHHADFAGGPVPGGPPDWLPSSNLTPHEDGLKGWTRDDLAKVLREGIRKDGTPVGVPMTLMTKYGNNMTEVEIDSLWMALAALPPVPDPKQ